MITYSCKLALDNRNRNINKLLFIAASLNCHKLTRRASVQGAIPTLYSLQSRWWFLLTVFNREQTCGKNKLLHFFQRPHNKLIALFLGKWVELAVRGVENQSIIREC